MASAAEQLAANLNFGAFQKATELQKRILFTVIAMVVYRLGTYIPIPGIDPVAFAQAFKGQSQGVLGMFNMFSGGAVERMAVFALNVMPYISASIIVQLLGTVYPPWEKLRKEGGEAGRKTLNQYTRYLTVVLALFQAASIASPPIYRRFPLETIEVNALGTWNLLRLAHARSVTSFLHLSSSEVYGDPENSAIPTPEEYVGRVSFTGPRACYDESKRLAETICRLYFEKHALPVKVVRPFNVYGPTLRLDDGRVVPDLLRQGLAGGPLVLYSDGTPTRSFCYVTDAIVAFLRVLTSDRNGEAFNVGTTEEVSMRQLAELTGEVLGIREVRLEASTDSRYLSDNPQRRCPDIRKIRDQIGWVPSVTLRDGLRLTAEYYRQRLAPA